MTRPLILASSSSIRRQLLQNAGLTFETLPARVDEDAIRASLLAEEATPRDVADALAQFKARKVSEKRPEAMVIGCDQVLDFKGTILSKPADAQEVAAQLRALAGQGHRLLSAAVIYDEGKPVWRHVGVVQMQMRPLSDGFIDDYVSRNWESIRHSVGGYKLEEEGARLFSRVQGDYFTVLGLPLLDLLSYLTLRGILSS
ncbi:Maf family protein [Oceaniglobus trochenteri]|uniref:Maf family protein n=1 Tax=Oceaniglobus trochenteri TaxID=2763260 RepID=UPI001CFFB38E|nr:Maf family nucleotide pyrophosphatase [Oceaniglobus trochenteri]